MSSRQNLAPSRRQSAAPASDLRVGVHDVAHKPGAQKRLKRTAVVPALGVGPVGVAEGDAVDLDLRFDGVGAGVVVEGFVAGAWTAECSRCLTAVTGPFDIEVHELFEDEPLEGETYLLEGDELDLEPLLRDAVLLEIPPAPLCGDDCLGLCPSCGTDRNTKPCECTIDTKDPRWAILDQLEFDES